jgi:hypothetical protein
MLIGERELKAVEQREQGARRRPWRATRVGAGHAGPPRSLSTPPTATVVAGVREGGGPQSPPPQGRGRGVSFCRGRAWRSSTPTVVVVARGSSCRQGLSYRTVGAYRRPSVSVYRVVYR